jgi:hypothetical protein
MGAQIKYFWKIKNIFGGMMKFDIKICSAIFHGVWDAIGDVNVYWIY